MPVQPESLANLAPQWPKGHQPPASTRQSRDVARAIRDLRRAAPDAVAYCVKLLNDENERPELRLKAALAIIEKAIPTHRSLDPSLALNTNGIQSLRVEFVSGDQMTVTRELALPAPKPIDAAD